MNIGLINIIDLAVLLVVFGIFFIFMMKKKNFKIFLMYTVILALYVGIYVVDMLYSLIVAVPIATVVVIFSMVALAVVYSSELKTLFFRLSKPTDKSQLQTFTDEDLRTAVEEIVKACQTMSKNRVGALLVIAPSVISAHILESGTELNALVTAPLLESIFNTKAPLHDGAVIIKGNKIQAAGCFLPLSQSLEINKAMGTRHRAAVGVTEEGDVLCVVVSEETGIISVAEGGKISRYITPERLTDLLHVHYGIMRTAKKRTSVF